MRNSCLSLFLGLTATTVVLTPMTVEAASFDYDRLEFLSTRPIESNDVLSFYGDQSQNEGYVVFSNEDPNAPDSGFISNGLNATFTSYYTTGRQGSPETSGATRSASLENITTGFPNFFKYLNSNNIPLSSIGFGYGQKSDRDFTKTWNLGEKELGQDYFARPDSTIQETLYQASSDDVEIFLSYGTTKIVDFGYSDASVVSPNDNPSTSFEGNLNVFLLDPVPASKVAGLDSLASGLADAFLQDVAAAGGSVQFVSEDTLEPADISGPIFNNGYQIFALSLPIEVRAVPEPSSTLGLLMFGALGAVAFMKRKNK